MILLDRLFLSAGQRCSALRVVYVQDDVADEYWDYLVEAMQELSQGNPINLDVDIGPIINKSSLEKLVAHSSSLKKKNLDLKN